MEGKMTLIYSVIFWFFLKASRCQLQCVTETFEDKKFSINVTGSIKLESGNCHQIFYKLTFPTNTVTAPYKKTWFKGDSANTVITTVGNEVNSETEDSFMIKGLPQGEYEYGLKLEWGCNQTYIFPKRVHISVSALTQKPFVYVHPMEEGQVAIVMCSLPRVCSGRVDVDWKWTKADGTPRVIDDSHNDYHDYYDDRPYHSFHPYRPFGRSKHRRLRLIPTADDHNSNITCVAKYEHEVVETTVTLTVRFLPKILNSSQCTAEGKLLVCMCISWGNPLPPITWPLVALTDYSVSSFSSNQTVTSTITLPAADNHNATVKCISRNEMGQAETDIPLRNGKENSKLNYGLDLKHNHDAVFPWIAVGVSLSLNLVLLITLIVCTRKWRKSKSHPKELCEEMNTYASLNATDVEQPYSSISSPSRQT